MRNVLQLIDSFDQGGSERQAVQLTKLLHQSGKFKVQSSLLRTGLKATGIGRERRRAPTVTSSDAAETR